MNKPILLAFSAILFMVIALGVYLMNGCQENVDPVNLYSKLNVSSYVLDSETFAGIADAGIAVDGDVVTTTDSNGYFTISELEPGDYLVSASKSCFLKGTYELAVEDNGARLPQFVLKKLADPVTIGTNGGDVEAFKKSGELAAEFAIPAGELQSNRQISVTQLTGNEVPKILNSTGQLLGTTITLNSDDESLEFTNGAQLTFQLPFPHRPGDGVEVTYFDENTNSWKVFDDAIVNANGLSATVTINHFSTYSANVNGNYSEETDVTLDYEIVGTSDDYEETFEWTTKLEYREGIPDNVDPEWLYTTVENQTKLNFSEVTYGNSTRASNVTGEARMISAISAPPVGNPYEYRSLPERPWELVLQCCWMHEIVEAEIWVEENNGFIVESVPNWYLVCAWFWIWRSSDNVPIPSACYCYYCDPPIIIIPPDHQGGSGN